MISYNQALEILLENANFAAKTTNINIKFARGRILACDIIANRNFPEFPTAAMDGFACRAKDLKQNAKLKIISSLRASEEIKHTIKQNECIKTFTGALMSYDCDALIPIENVEIQNDFIIIKEVVKEKFAVRDIAESYKKGDVLLKKGTKIDFAEICVLAELGLKEVCVFSKLNIAILATGSELVDLQTQNKPKSKIYNTNSYSIAALIEKFGQKAIILPYIKDDENELKQALKSALNKFDIVISTGGVSVGDFDFMRDFIRNNTEVLIDKVAIKPGRHIKIAKLQNKFIFALPGFSYSAMVTTILFIKPFLQKIFCMQEEKAEFAVLTHDYIKKGEFENFSAAQVFNENGTLKISTKNTKEGSSAISINLLQNSVLLRANQNYKLGDIVKFIRI